MSKIKEIVVEPTNIHIGSVFRLKVKVERGLTYEELKTTLYRTGQGSNDITYRDIKEG